MKRIILATAGVALFAVFAATLGSAQPTATTGPAMGVGLVIASESLHVADYAGRVDLLRALGDHNGIFFSRRHLDEWHALRAR